jgi:uncharacterized repeat protein (TIGR02543 family)
MAAVYPTSRSDKWKNFAGHFIIAYLDGVRPSLVYQHKNRQPSGQMTGGYGAWHFANGRLVEDWRCVFQKDDTEYESHQIRAADVDGDGKDEIVEISYAVDDDGSYLYYAQDVAHGDRHCLADIDPDRPGLEQFYIQQTNIIGMGLFDALNGEIVKALYMGSVTDVGRGVCAAFDPTRRGLQFFSTMNGNQLFDCKGNAIEGATGTFPGEALWWGGDLARWEVSGIGGSGDNIALQRYNPTTKTFARDLPNLYSEKTPYYFKSFYGGRAAFWGDILGDWREEMVCPRTNGTGFVVLSTWEKTAKRIYCLMQNPAYRDQTTARGYYQTADVDFYMAADMPKPPVAPVQKADTVMATGNALTSAVNGLSVMYDLQNPNSSVAVSGDVSPATLWLMNPKGKNYTFGGSGKLTGAAQVVKSMQGDVTLNGNHDYTGKTRISEGRLFVNGALASPVQVDARGVLGGRGTLSGGATLEVGLNVHGARIEPGNGASLDTLTIVGSVALPGRNNLAFEVDQTQPLKKNDVLKIQGNLSVSGSNHSITINPLTDLQPDTLTLVMFTGETNATAEAFTVIGLEGVPYVLFLENGQIKLALRDVRPAGEVTWSGSHGAAWDFQTKNFLHNGMEDIFVPGDAVLFNDSAASKSVTLVGVLPAASVTVSTDGVYDFGGAGGISGSGYLKKEGTGTLKINNVTNTYSGATQLLGGTLEAVSIGMAGAESSLGAGADLQISNATLTLTGVSASDRSVSMAEKVTLNMPTAGASLTLLASIVGPTADMVKEGEGMLSLQGDNTFKSVTVRNGTLVFGSADANSKALGSATITMEGGALQMFNVNTTSVTGPFTTTVNVPSGKVAYWYLPQRWIFTNKLTGGGTIYINAPYVRSDFNCDWSEFHGVVNFTGRDIRLNSASARDLTNVEVNLGSEAYLYCASNGGGESSTAQTITFGALSGSGSIAGKNSLIIGERNTGSAYSGAIGSGAGKLTKRGTAALTLSGSNAYTGGTDVESGTLIVANTDGSATGTGSVTVSSGGKLAGTGSIAGSVTITENSYLFLQNAACDTLNLKSDLTLQPGAVTALDVDAATLQSDVISVAGSATVAGRLELLALGGEDFQVGMEFRIFCAAGSVKGTYSEITPALGSSGLEWDQSQIARGVVSVQVISHVTVTISANGGAFADGDSVAAQRVKIGTAFGHLLPPASREGYDFVGWQYPGGEAYAGEAAITDTALSARWTAKLYLVKFVSEGRTIASTPVAYSDTAAKPADPTREGYTFGGWYSGESEWDFSSPITGGLTLTAQWRQNPVEQTPTAVAAGALSTVTLYPNPASSLVTITGLAGGDVINLVDASGALLLTRKAAGAAESIAVGNLPSGIYYVQVAKGKASKTFKLTVQ